MSERWLPVVGYEGIYEVSDIGRVRALVDYGRHRAGRITLGRRFGRNSQTYRRMTLYKTGRASSRFVHSLVLEAFVGLAPEGMLCRHLNGVHDDNRLENLAWGTHQENMADRDRHGRTATGHRSGTHTRPESRPRGERNANAKLTDQDIPVIRDLLSAGGSYRGVGRQFGVSGSSIGAIAQGKAWTHV